MQGMHFNCLKMVQAIAALLKQPGKDSNNYYKLLKLLYIAEKESLLETGHPITGDKLVTMPHGPALSATCDLMRGRDTRDEWTEHIARQGRYGLHMVADPGDDLLCDYEVEKLSDVAQRHASRTWKAVRAFCHKFPEQSMNDPGKSSKEIPLEDIGMSAESIQCANDVAGTQRAIARVAGK